MKRRLAYAFFFCEDIHTGQILNGFELEYKSYEKQRKYLILGTFFKIIA